MNRDEQRRARAALFAGLTGRPVPGGAMDTRGQLLAAYGTDVRGRPNIRAAAPPDPYRTGGVKGCPTLTRCFRGGEE